MGDQERKVLDLMNEYRESVANRQPSSYSDYGPPAGRDPEVISEEFGAALRALLGQPIS